jgi:hypothetical protein
MTATWRDVPRGYFAFPIYDIDGLDPDRDDVEPEVIGHQCYERRVPRTHKNGRTVGRDRWRKITYKVEGVEDWQRVLDNRLYMDEAFEIERMVEDPSRYQAEFGRLTGKCGCCGRRLTDPDSKMRGIGPECAGLRRSR